MLNRLQAELIKINHAKDIAYTERNRLAIAFVKLAIKNGLAAGRGIDKSRTVDDEWRHVVYVEFSDGSQVSWHIAPSEVYLLDDISEFPKEWDGTFLGKNADWVKKI